MTDRLRDLLEQAVPDDAPTLDPHRVAEAARRGRNRSRAGLAGAAVLVVLGGAATFAVLDGRGDDAVVADGSGPAPYDAPSCPLTLPELADASTSVDSLDGLASVRLCPDLGASPLGDAMPESQQKAILAGMDALVDDLPGFADRIAGTESFDPARCAVIDVFNSRQSLQLTYDDGHTALLPTAACSPITVAGRAIDGQYLGAAYLAALDRQRSEVDYTFHGTVPLTCELQTTPGPARPGRDRVVAAIACPPDGSRTVLDGDRLHRLAGEWGTAGPPPAPPRSDCAVRSDLPVLVVATDHGDVVRIRQDRCDVLTPELAWTDPDLPDGFALTTTMADLGLA